MQPKTSHRFGKGMLLPVGLCCAMVLSCAQADPDSKEPPANITGLFGDTLVKSDGTQTGIKRLENVEIIAIYFSAQWCPPCRAFTPLLVETANTLKRDGKSFEVVFVSSDRSAGDMLAYMQAYKMNWPALPHRSEAAKALSARYGISGIPALIIIDSAGNTLSENGRGEVASKGTAAYDDWKAGIKANQP